MNIIYYPFKLSRNKFVEISQSYIKKCGYDIVDFSRIYKNSNEMKQCGGVFLNWYESIYGNLGIFSLYIEILKRKIKLLILKFYKIKVVFTFHNKFPHNTDKNRKCLIRKYMKWICKHSDYILILSKSSEEYLRYYLSKKEIYKKVRYVPHPNYIGVYSPEIKDNIYPETRQFSILFVGQIRRYKNIELILEVAEHFKDQPITFHIAGCCDDYKYKEKIIKQTSLMPNIELDLRFVEDNEMDHLIRQYHILLLPYDITSSMNSGTAILAFSNGRTVICPEICTVQEFDLNDIYSYQYESEDEHRLKLIRRVSDAYEDWKYNREKFENKGTRLLKAVKRNNSPEKLLECYKSLLSEIEFKRNYSEPPIVG